MARIKDIPIIQVVGYKKSGKTTIIESLIKHLKEKGYNVGVIKHHGHGGPPDKVEPENADTSRFQEAGASVTSVEGEGVFQIRVINPDASPLEMVLKMYEPLPLDVILVEGYKQGDFPKLVVCDTSKDMEELLALTNVIGIIDRSTGSDPVNVTIPIFHLSRPHDYNLYIEQFIKRS